MDKFPIEALVDHQKEIMIYHRTMFKELVQQGKMNENYITDAEQKEQQILDTLLFCEKNIDGIREFMASKKQPRQTADETIDHDKISMATKHCCTVLQERDFQRFLYHQASAQLDHKQHLTLPDSNSDDYFPQIIRLLLNIKSRAELSKNKDAFKRWRTLYEHFKSQQNYEDYSSDQAAQ